MSRFHFYNSANRPNPYKIYQDLPSIALPIQKSEKDFSALKAISGNIKFERPSKRILLVTSFAI
ncbi:MAG: hypothetical protein IIA83_09300 [Thaumarchaeota archaeon]|nr:hypothetical protein [Nitrososphaerota archaeon]